MMKFVKLEILKDKTGSCVIPYRVKLRLSEGDSGCQREYDVCSFNIECDYVELNGEAL